MRNTILASVGVALMAIYGCSAAGAEDDGGSSDGSGANSGSGAGSNVGGGIGSGGNGSGGGEFNGEICGESTYGNQIAGALLVVLDRSGSMGDPPSDGQASKWSSTVAGLNSMTASASPELQMGILPFPEGNFDDLSLALCFTQPTAPGCPAILADAGCADVATQAAVAIAPLQQNASLINGWLSGESPGGNTPTLYALKNGYDIVRSYPTQGQRFVLLMTDGEPTLYQPGGGLLPASGTLCGDLAGIENEVAQAAGGSDPVNTFVIGSPGSEGSATFLSQLAVNGNTPKDANCSPGAGNCHYQIGSSNFEQELKAVLETIAGQVSDCIFDLPLDEDTDPNLVNVTIETPNGKVDIYKDPGHVDGWDYTDSSQTKIQLFGPACELYKAQPGNAVNIIIGCPTVLK